MKRIIPIVICLVMNCAAAVHASGAADAIKVMTRNQYLGADLTPVILAQSPEEFVAAAGAALRQIAANDFPRRARGFAREVLLTQPDVIGLQEVFDFRLNGANAGGPFVDQLQLTLNALSALGLRYVVAGAVRNIDLTLPLDVNGDGAADSVRIVDRDVILVRAGLSHTSLRGSFTAGGLCGVPVPNPIQSPSLPPLMVSEPSDDGCTYEVVAVVHTPFGRIDVARGFLGVDVVVGGRTYRVVNTHLEVRRPDPANPGSAIIQFLQSVELAGTLLQTTPAGRKLIALGDYNSSAVDAPDPFPPPYQVMAGAGFADAWNSNALAVLDPDGFTCCEQADLANRRSIHSERVDLILVRNAGSFLPLAVVTGRVPLLPAFRPPYWTSDHAGVFGILVFH